jgi:radical SAM superfamily enzyme YgiQ (UPF0313 family)
MHSLFAQYKGLCAILREGLHNMTGKNRKKLILVNPVNPHRAGFSINHSSKFPPLSLGIIASLTPDDWDVEVIDENFDEFSFRHADLVGITAFTSAANRAYEIAAIYRDRNIPVVMGGIHASMCSEEASQFVDVVVVGEVESVWDELISDFLSDQLKPIYKGLWNGLGQLCKPRRDIYSNEYLFASIQTSRGCPMDCDFCSVSAFNGLRYRQRPPSEVLDELEQIPQELIFFVDDNIIGYGKRSRKSALELFKGMVDRGIKKHWFCQASINIADDEEVLHWAAKAGCRMMFLGIEAEDLDSLSEVNKKLNIKRGGADAYEPIFERIHNAGIAVLGAFIFGMDEDTPEKLFKRARYMLDCGVDVMQATALTPLPGTRLFARLKDEGRLLYTNFPEDWDYYDLTKVVFKPGQMKAEEFSAVMRECMKIIYDPSGLKDKARQTLKYTGRWDATEFAYQSNKNYQCIAMAESTFT